VTNTLQSTISDFDRLATARWVDLSLTVSDDHPSWPGHRPFTRTVSNWFAPSENSETAPTSLGPYATGWWAVDEHTGTHFDAPAHFIPPPGSGLRHAGPLGSITVEQVELAKLRGRACVIDVRSQLGQADLGHSPAILPEAIDAFEAVNGHVGAGDIVLFRTDWDSNYLEGRGRSRYIDDVLAGRAVGWPAPTPATVAYLADKGVETVGIDAASLGPAEDGAPTHVEGLSRGVAFVEGLARLVELPARGAYFLFLPVKVRGATGGLGRAVGLVPPLSSDGSARR
jgi:kynurenine formamidase